MATSARTGRSNDGGGSRRWCVLHGRRLEPGLPRGGTSCRLIWYLITAGMGPAAPKARFSTQDGLACWLVRGRLQHGPSWCRHTAGVAQWPTNRCPGRLANHHRSAGHDFHAAGVIRMPVGRPSKHRKLRWTDTSVEFADARGRTSCHPPWRFERSAGRSSRLDQDQKQSVWVVVFLSSWPRTPRGRPQGEDGWADAGHQAASPKSN